MEQFALSPLIGALRDSAARHDHLCPRQVLGARIGLAGLAALGLCAPVTKRTALIVAETDGCFADGLQAATGASVGHRTLRVADLGRIAATFADVATGRAIRVAPAADIRRQAGLYAPGAKNRYEAQLQAYQSMPDEDLLKLEAVILQPSIERLISRPGARVNCGACGEEIVNERETVVEGTVLCGACAGQGYYLQMPRGRNPVSLSS